MGRHGLREAEPLAGRVEQLHSCGRSLHLLLHHGQKEKQDPIQCFSKAQSRPLWLERVATRQFSGTCLGPVASEPPRVITRSAAPGGPGRHNLRNRRSLRGVGWQGRGGGQSRAMQITERGPGKRPGRDSGFRDISSDFLQKTIPQPSPLSREAISLHVHQGIDPFVRSEPPATHLLWTHSHRHPDSFAVS